MHIETVKLSPKRGGNGYTSSYSFSIGSKEAAACGLIGKRIIKIIDEENGIVSFKAKQFTIKRETINEVTRLKRSEQIEYDKIRARYAKKAESLSGAVVWRWSLDDMMQLSVDEAKGKVKRPNRNNLENFLLRLPVETLADLLLLMYLGRDYNVNMNTEPGEERFLNYYDNYNYIVLGLDASVLAAKLMEKAPLIQYLETGLQLLDAPNGTDINELIYGPQKSVYKD